MEVLRAYYSLIDKDFKSILEDLTAQQNTQPLVELVTSVKDSQKHFHLFLQHSRNQMSQEKSTVSRVEPPKKKSNSDKPSAVSVLNDFRQELLEYTQLCDSMVELKSRKESLFAYGNTAVLEDFRKINHLSLMIKLLKKDTRTPIEELKIKVGFGLIQTYMDMKNSVEDSRQESAQDASALGHGAYISPELQPNEDDSPTLKKLKELNRKFCTDQFSRKP